MLLDTYFIFPCTHALCHLLWPYNVWCALWCLAITTVHDSWFRDEIPTLSFKQQGGPSIQLLTSQKYYCKLAGERVKFCWGLQKDVYCNITVDKKKTKKEFDKCVRDAVEFVEQQHVTRFSSKCRHYIITYNTSDANSNPLTYKVVEHFLKKMKKHQNNTDQETGEIKRVWKESTL